MLLESFIVLTFSLSRCSHWTNALMNFHLPHVQKCIHRSLIRLVGSHIWFWEESACLPRHYHSLDSSCSSEYQNTLPSSLSHPRRPHQRRPERRLVFPRGSSVTFVLRPLNVIAYFLQHINSCVIVHQNRLKCIIVHWNRLKYPQFVILELRTHGPYNLGMCWP